MKRFLPDNKNTSDDDVDNENNTEYPYQISLRSNFVDSLADIEALRNMLHECDGRWTLVHDHEKEIVCFELESDLTLFKLATGL